MCVFRAATMMHATYSQMVQQIYTLYVCVPVHVCVCVSEREKENTNVKQMRWTISSS